MLDHSVQDPRAVVERDACVGRANDEVAHRAAPSRDTPSMMRKVGSPSISLRRWFCWRVVMARSPQVRLRARLRQNDESESLGRWYRSRAVARTAPPGAARPSATRPGCGRIDRDLANGPRPRRCEAAALRGLPSKLADQRRHHHPARVAGLRVKRTRLTTRTHTTPMMGETNRE